MNLSICYVTSRLNPRWHWFRDSLHRETGGDYSDITLIVVDRHAPRFLSSYCPMKHVAPKPNVWMGQHRLTSKDYFAASNTRNTAICLAPDGWIVFVDDLSVLLPGWLAAVREAMAGSYVAAGAYKKVLDLVVNDGLVVSCTETARGTDSRWHYGDTPIPIPGSQLFGASLACPVEWLLEINGFDEDCDSVGGEDYALGMMLQAHGRPIRYCRRMLTYEDDLAHGEEPPMIRIDKGKSPNDKSHAMLHMIQGGRRTAPNYFGDGGIREVRRRVLAGEPFPVTRCPTCDWYDAMPLSEM